MLIELRSLSYLACEYFWSLALIFSIVSTSSFRKRKTSNARHHPPRIQRRYTQVFDDINAIRGRVHAVVGPPLGDLIAAPRRFRPHTRPA